MQVKIRNLDKQIAKIQKAEKLLAEARRLLNCWGDTCIEMELSSDEPPTVIVYPSKD